MVDVLRKNEVSLDGNFYHIKGPVRTSGGPQYPEKIVFGDVDRDSGPNSIVEWSDWTGGSGLYLTDGREGMTRFNTSQCDTRHKGHLVLSVLHSAVADPSVSGAMNEISELAGDIYAALNGGTDAYKWTHSGDTWSSKLHDFPAAVTDSEHFTLGGTEYVAFAHTGGYTYTSNGSSWTDDTTNALLLAYWDDRLWGIDNDGQLWFAITIGTEVNDARLPLPAGYVNRLFTGPDASGEDILYAATEVGLYAHDALNARFVRTKVYWPQNSEAGKGAATWNGDIYVCPGGTAVYRYDPVRGLVDRGAGLDRDAGLPSGHRGDITRLIPTHNGLVAIVGGSTTRSAHDYNGEGWHWLFDSSAEISGAHASDVGGTYRLYFDRSNRLRYRELFVGEVNPDIDTINYEGSREHVTPWFTAGQNEVDKLAIRVRLDCTDMSSDETVQVQFALDYSNTYESSTVTITADGVTTATFPTIADNVSEAGSEFRAIRFRLLLDHDAATDTPNVKSLSLEWRRKLPAKYGFEFDIVRTLNSRDKRSPAKQKADIITAVEKSTLVDFTFVDEAGTEQNYRVDARMQDMEQTGKGERGVTRIMALER
jgi:hypothetical protein